MSVFIRKTSSCFLWNRIWFEWENILFLARLEATRECRRRFSDGSYFCSPCVCVCSACSQPRHLHQPSLSRAYKWVIAMGMRTAQVALVSSDRSSVRSPTTCGREGKIQFSRKINKTNFCCMKKHFRQLFPKKRSRCASPTPPTPSCV